MLKKNKKVILCVLLLIIIYFSFSVTITWDTAHYFSFVEIFEGLLPWNSWDIVRGPTFPLLIYISNFLFGKTVQGLLINSFIYYIIMLFFVHKICNEVFDESQKKKKVLTFATLLIIILNPIIFGYYHALLTEFIAMTLSVVSCYLSYLWLGIDFNKEKAKYVVFIIVFSILFIFSWFLKQPYISTTLFPMIAAAFISIVKKFNVSNIIQRLGAIMTCMFIFVISLSMWSMFLNYIGTDNSIGRDSGSMLGAQLFNAVDHCKLASTEYYEIDRITNSKYFNKEEKQLILDNPDLYKIVNVTDNKKNIIDQMLIASYDDKISTKSYVTFWIKTIFKHPVLVAESYVANYLAISNIYPIATIDGVSYQKIRKIDLTFNNEIYSIGYRIYQPVENVFYMTNEMQARVNNYRQNNSPSTVFLYIYQLLCTPANILFKLILVLLPFAWLFSTVMVIINRKNARSKVLEFTFILLTYSFLHVLMHAVTGAFIDRYSVPMLITSILGMIFLIYYIVTRNRKAKNDCIEHN
ncbi:MAG: hypothetical protein RR404_00780 [Bacilli bacterium]